MHLGLRKQICHVLPPPDVLPVDGHAVAILEYLVMLHCYMHIVFVPSWT